MPPIRLSAVPVLETLALCLIVVSGCSHPASECDDDADCPEGQKCLSVLDRPSAPALSVTGDYLQAPESTSEDDPMALVTVQATVRELRVDDETVAELGEQFAVDDDDDNPRRIAPLADELERIRVAREQDAALLDREYDPKLTLVADQSIPTDLLHSILYTARKKGFDNIRLATRRAPRSEVWSE